MESTRPSKLEDLSKQDLITRIHALEAQLPSSPRRHNTPTKPFPFHAHPARKVAFKFSYAGWAYNGLAAQSQPTPLPTVEQVLFDALVATRLVDPAGGMDGCGWSRCGRTDRGVSAAGQVVSLRVRSAVGERPMVESERREVVEVLVQEEAVVEEDTGLPIGLASPGSSRSSTPPPTTEPRRELAYVHMLNRVLPSTIRILAWSPVSDTFDARFSCQYRHYKYLFPRGGRTGEALDITAMRDAARRFVGEHDFRNFCKLDPSKQIENFSRRVMGAWIERVDRDSFEDAPEQDSVVESGAEEMYVFNLKGTAFLWHQVRCIMAVLFLVGSKLEQPDIVDYLLHTSPTLSKSSSLPDSTPPVESKPNYTMADALPLVLWDCGYRSEDVAWQTDAQVETRDGTVTNRERTHNFWYQLYSTWSHDQIQTTMQGYFLRAGEVFYPSPSPGLADSTPERIDGPVKLNMGGGVFRHMSKYIPVLELDRGERAEVANVRWREGAAGKRRMAKRDAKKGQEVESVHED